jgi:hypothetical protein
MAPNADKMTEAKVAHTKDTPMQSFMFKFDTDSTMGNTMAFGRVFSKTTNKNDSMGPPG